MMNPVQLEDEFNQGGDGEHPTYSRDDWRKEVAQLNTLCGYWDWVFNKLNSSRHVYVCAVRMAISASSTAEAGDAVNEMLRPHLRNKESALVDWNYDEWGGMQALPVGDDFGEDSGVPQLPKRAVSLN
jgi:hypothetical protein